jgi:hypothetical protein
MGADDPVIGRLVAGDSPELSKLARRVHGAGCLRSAVDDPLALARRIESDLHLGIVAGLPGGRLHGAAVFERRAPHETTGYVNLFMVDGELSAALLRELIGLCRAHRMMAAYVVSDDAAAREGATEIAVQFAVERHARSELRPWVRPSRWRFASARR